MQRVLVICNPTAGGGSAADIVEMYRRFAENVKDTDYHFYLTSKPGDFDGITEAIQCYDPHVISVVGGDGTVNEVVNVKEVHKRALHLIPAGSGNDFAHLVYGNLSLEDSFRLSASIQRKPYDFGICNDRYFINGVGIGFDANVAMHTARMKLPILPSRFKYAIAILRNLFFYKGRDMVIGYNEEVLEKELFMVNIANGCEYGGGFRVSPLSKADDGLLNVVIVRDLPPVKRIFKLLKVKKGRHMDDPIVKHDLTHDVTVELDRSEVAHLDGELLYGQSFRISIAGQIEFVV